MTFVIRAKLWWCWHLWFVLQLLLHLFVLDDAYLTWLFRATGRPSRLSWLVHVLLYIVLASLDRRLWMTGVQVKVDHIVANGGACRFDSAAGFTDNLSSSARTSSLLCLWYSSGEAGRTGWFLFLLDRVECVRVKTGHWWRFAWYLFTDLKERQLLLPRDANLSLLVPILVHGLLAWRNSIFQTSPCS